jgi:hypothetical protein
MKKRLSNDTIFNLLSLALAACMIASPYLYGAKTHIAAGMEWVIGFVVAYGSIAAMFEYSEWPKWVGLVGGLWLAVSPWIMGFHATVTPATKADVLLGAALAVIAAVQLWNVHHTPPRITTHA